MLTAMTTNGGGVDEKIGTNVARKRPATISTDMATDGDGVVEEIATDDARKRRATISTDMATDGDGVAEEEIATTDAGKRPTTISTAMETDGDGVDAATHDPYSCYCYLEEDAAPIQQKFLRQTLSFDRDLLIKKKGGYVDLEELLFTPERDYLINSDGQKVQMHDLSNKYVLLYTFPLVERVKFLTNTMELVHLRKYLLDRRCCFEIVFVALGSDTGHYFKKYSSLMTWPFIPYEDHDGRERVRTAFGFNNLKMMNDYPYFGIVDPNGTLLQSWAWRLLNYYGHDAFPFTDEKFLSLHKEEASVFTEGVSLTKLLSSYNRDYVLSPQGEKVPIQDLENKVVCIILDNPRERRTDFIRKYLEAFKLDEFPDFVTVYVCRDFADGLHTIQYTDLKDKGENICESAGWFRIPYGDPSTRKIWRVILRHRRRNYEFATVCNVVGPLGSYINFFALHYMIEFGTRAYPFTLQQLAELDSYKDPKEYDVPLEVFLQPACQMNCTRWFEAVLHPNCRFQAVLHPNCRFPYNGRKVGKATVLYNKRLLVLFGTHSCCELGQFLCELKSLYKQKKGTNEEFEVLYISFDCLQSDFEKSILGMPWYAFPFKMEGAMEMWSQYRYELPWSGGFPAIASFDRDGRLVGMEGDLHRKKDRCADFPYVNSIAVERIKLFHFCNGKIPSDFEFWTRF